MKQQELQKFQNSAFDEFAQKKFIEDQKIIMELSGRLQELQNEVNCMARGMGPPRHATNRRRRTRKGPEPACVSSPLYFEVAHAGGKG